MTDTLILFKPLADFGEALKKECPKNDCTSYLYTYEQYCAIYADYKRIKETIADLSEAAVRVLEHAIRKTEAELYKMWFENYAVLKQRAALGMAASAERRATSSGKTNFEALTADAQGLGRFLRSIPVLGIRNFKSDIVAGAWRRIATLARTNASETIPNGGCPLKRIAGWRCEEETKTDRGGAFNGNRRDPACRIYAVERDTGNGTVFGRTYGAYIPFPNLDACTGNGRNGLHTGRGRG